MKTVQVQLPKGSTKQRNKVSFTRDSLDALEVLREFHTKSDGHTIRVPSDTVLINMLLIEAAKSIK